MSPIARKVTGLLARPAPPTPDTDTIHEVCADCQPDGGKAICGTPTAGGRWVTEGDPRFDCVVCADLLCPKCGQW